MISYRKIKKKRDIEINDYLEYIIGIDLSFQSKERYISEVGRWKKSLTYIIKKYYIKTIKNKT